MTSVPLDKIHHFEFSTRINYTFQKGDIKDSVLFKKILFEFNPDSIINFAAESHVDRSIDGPKAFIDNNIVTLQYGVQILIAEYINTLVCRNGW